MEFAAGGGASGFVEIDGRDDAAKDLVPGAAHLGHDRAHERIGFVADRIGGGANAGGRRGVDAGVAPECLGNRGAGEAKGEGERADGGSIGHGANQGGGSLAGLSWPTGDVRQLKRIERMRKVNVRLMVARAAEVGRISSSVTKNTNSPEPAKAARA